MEHCIYCQSVYELQETNSSIPTSLCSKECEDGFKEDQKLISLELNNAVLQSRQKQ